MYVKTLLGPLNVGSHFGQVEPMSGQFVASEKRAVYPVLTVKRIKRINAILEKRSLCSSYSYFMNNFYYA